MREEKHRVYIAEDGKKFLNKKDCVEHEKQLSLYTYWVVTHGPDLTEGRGYYHRTYLRVSCTFKHCVESLLTDYCYKTFGDKTAFIMGVQPMPNWLLCKSTADQFREKQRPKVGDFYHNAHQKELVFENKQFVEVSLNGNEN